MLKHILTGQPATASRHQTSSNDHYSPGGLQALAANGSAIHQHQHQHQHLHQDQQHLHHTHHQHRVGGTIGTRGGSVDAYDSIGGNSSSLHNIRSTGNPGAVTTTPSSSHQHPLNHSQLSVNNLSQRLNHSHGLNLSTLSTSKHSVDSASPVVGANASNSLHHQIHHHPVGGTGHQISSSVDRPDGEPRPKVNGGLDITRLSRIPSHATPSPAPAPSSTSGALPPLANSGPSIVPLNASITSSFSQHNRHHQAAGVKEMLTSLGLLCLVSLLLALLSLIFLLKISPLTESPSSLIGHDESVVVYEVTLALCALALSLNLCCLLVCAIQFLFAVKLVKSSYQGSRTNKYLQKSSISRVCAVGGFFISIPVFLTGMILYTFVQFHSTPAIVTSVFIGLGIIFCGCAMVHNVFVWQREKTNAIKALAREQCEAAAQLQRQQIQQQQQLQQQHQHHQHHQKHHQHQGQSQHHSQRGTLNQSALSSGSRGGQKTVAIPQTHSTATLPGTHGSRGHPYHPHNHHHASVTPAGAQSHLQQIVAGSHRNIATPPTPGNLSPPSPSHKHNRSHVLARDVSGSVSPGLPTATLDLSSAANTNSPHELSTLV
ncbi:uncharacterized protein LOC124178844 [Neodiprion fabricii]|uniref:uncharacterized protein LOC124178844 n=1 Tax=Neodiprion fabricii TaxID=2872261 RepID=UPI001ED91A64|nr:uncharacterized protein LOC124178844 [Neodiprion fabricii]XP_046418533.1 uncharacterized protein LOC124178844 [Neodiprion fabricii]